MTRAPKAHWLSDKNLEARTATCRTCGPVEIFVRNGPDGLPRTTCAPGERARKSAKRRENPAYGRGDETFRNRKPTTPEAQRRYALKYKYGLTPEEVSEMLESQNGLCLICAEDIRESPNVDHDHGTGRIRGLLCFPCNLGLGHFRDRPDLLAAAITYLDTPSLERVPVST